MKRIFALAPTFPFQIPVFRRVDAVSLSIWGDVCLGWVNALGIHEVQWLNHAVNMPEQRSDWIVSYEFDFPPE